MHGAWEHGRWWAIISGTEYIHTWMWLCWSQTAAATEGLAALAQGVHHCKPATWMAAQQVLSAASAQHAQRFRQGRASESSIKPRPSATQCPGRAHPNDSAPGTTEPPSKEKKLRLCDMHARVLGTHPPKVPWYQYRHFFPARHLKL